MKNMNLFLPGFHLATLRRKPRSAQQIMAEKITEMKQKTFSQLSECFGRFIPSTCLQPSKTGALSRRRFFSKENTFWAFFSQVLDADGGCQEVVRKLQAFAAMKSAPLPSSSTAAYCQARQKLKISELETALQQSAQYLQSKPHLELFHSRRVIVVDGTGISMPDTQQNQAVWPQQRNQKPGCGFPQASVCACFCLYTGSLLSYELGNKKSHELPMLRKQLNTFKTGDIFLGDKGFCSFYDINNFKNRGVDSVITLARRIPVKEATAVKVLGDNDYLIHWKKPVKTKSSSYSQTDWEALPDTLLLRQIKVTVDQPGYRVSTFYFVTTLLDSESYPASELADLYFQRWQVELFFRDIKTTMGMDVLRCKTPDMIRKELLMHLIAYNCTRCLIFDASDKENIAIKRISFKASIQAIRQWEPHLNQAHLSRHKQLELIVLLYESIAKKTIIDRPGRSEPRAVKRRPKQYQLLNKPRAIMEEIKHRSRYRAERA